MRRVSSRARAIARRQLPGAPQTAALRAVPALRPGRAHLVTPPSCHARRDLAAAGYLRVARRATSSLCGAWPMWARATRPGRSSTMAAASPSPLTSAGRTAVADAEAARPSGPTLCRGTARTPDRDREDCSGPPRRWAARSTLAGRPPARPLTVVSSRRRAAWAGEPPRRAARRSPPRARAAQSVPA